MEYFIEHTEKLVIYYIMPRGGKEQNLVRCYDKKRMIYEKKFFSPGKMVLCYLLLYLNFIRIIFKFYSSKEKFYFICGHPLFSFLKSFLNIFRHFEVVYFVGDYYPGPKLLNIIYHFLSQHYHDRCRFKSYLSDRLNKIYNKKVINNNNIKTIMWGVKPAGIFPKDFNQGIKLCFIGAIRESHGLELLFKLLKFDRQLKVKILGTCEKNLFYKYQKIIKNFNLNSQIYFPNRFLSDSELESESKDCHIGMALYNSDSGTRYSDPGKIKTYAQLGLPVIMTDTAEIVKYIKKFKAGEIVRRNISAINKAIYKIYNDYSSYQAGLKEFNDFFNYQVYYSKRFKFLEKD